MFWDGNRWVDERPAAQPHATTRFRDAIATAGMMIGLAALILPLSSAQARSPRVTVSPATGEPGQLIQMRGNNLPPRTSVEIVWDGGSIGVPTQQTTGGGAFKVPFAVPVKASIGSHTLGVRTADASTRSESPGTGDLGVPPIEFVVSEAGSLPSAPPAATLPPAATAIPTSAATPPPTAVPPAPTADPPPAATPNPPAPTPAPTANPPASNCTATLALGTGDRTADLKAIINSVPNGATICFEAGTHRINGNLRFFDRSGLTFLGPATIVTSTTSRGNLPLFEPIDSTRIVFRDLVLEGGRPDPGKYWPDHEHEHAISFMTSSGTVDGLTMRNWGGDGVYAGSSTPSSSSSYSHDIIVRNSIVNGTGRMGVAVTAGTNISIIGNSFDRIALSTIDLEPNYDYHGAHNILVADNTIKRYGLDPLLYPYFFQADADRGSYTDITIRNNDFVGSVLTVRMGIFSPHIRLKNVVITGNHSDTAGMAPFDGAILNLWHIDGLRVANNVQPVGRGPLLGIVDCTGVTLQ